MHIGLPNNYPSACALPFNRESFEKDFQLSTPDKDPGGEGYALLLKGANVLTTLDDIPKLPMNICPELLQQPPLYIGQWQGRPCRMSILNGDESFLENYVEHSLHAGNPQIPLSLLSLAGVGLMIQHWEDSSCFCGHCGKEMVRLNGEWGKKCSACGSHHFPRIHPCVIGLIIKGDELLLVRKAEWVEGRYGLVAGFVEFGESLEEAMVRETEEETGIKITNLRYIGSQCWPFPSQIMNGFVADYVSGDIKLQVSELEAGAWYKIDSLPTLPPRRSIARYLIDKAAEYIK